MKSNAKHKKGLIFDIQRYCLHDGPGVRTVVFFKGCPLRCQWCANPESLNSYQEIGYNKKDCIGCHKCIKACQNKAISFSENGVNIDREKCKQCFKCVKACPTDALRIFGEWLKIDAVVDIVLKDEMFYKNSDGGVTLSGGELLLQGRFASKLLEKVKKHGIHTAIETSGYAAWETLEHVLTYTDLVLFDIKHTNSSVHRKYTGVDNRLILDNLERIKKLGKPLLVRIPLIPGVDMEEQTVDAYITMLKEYDINTVNLLPFHQLGQTKYEMLRMNYTFSDIRPPADKEIEAVGKRFEDNGIQVTIGG